eukprot:1385496-Prymnesium_polylepis.1
MEAQAEAAANALLAEEENRQQQPPRPIRKSKSRRRPSLNREQKAAAALLNAALLHESERLAALTSEPEGVAGEGTSAADSCVGGSSTANSSAQSNGLAARRGDACGPSTTPLPRRNEDGGNSEGVPGLGGSASAPGSRSASQVGSPRRVRVAEAAWATPDGKAEEAAGSIARRAVTPGDDVAEDRSASAP